MKTAEKNAKQVQRQVKSGRDTTRHPIRISLSICAIRLRK
jgi:hypothetical protein